MGSISLTQLPGEFDMYLIVKIRNKEIQQTQSAMCEESELESWNTSQSASCTLRVKFIFRGGCLAN